MVAIEVNPGGFTVGSVMASPLLVLAFFQSLHHLVLESKSSRDLTEDQKGLQDFRRMLGRLFKSALMGMSGSASMVHQSFIILSILRMVGGAI